MTDTSNGNAMFDRFDETTCIHCGTVLNIVGREPFSPLECTNCHTIFPVPTQLGDYVLLDKLGQGGMGAVFRGIDAKLKRPVAVKVMRRQLGGNQEFTGQFLREAQTLAALNNPHIVQVHNFGEKHGQPYIVMELVDGGHLDRMIKEHGALKESFVIHMALDVIKGLRAAANMGLAHGDLKPDNVLFDRDGNAKVVDFGLARFKDEVHRPGEIWGTPFYIAPEVIHGKQPNPQADIYSLGCTLFHALAGQPPFSKETVQETVLARLKERPPDLQTLRPGIHPETASIIARMLEVDPFRRYPNYDSLMADMVAVEKALHHGPLIAKPKRTSTWKMAVIVVLIAIGGIILYRSARTESSTPSPQKPRLMKSAGGKLVPSKKSRSTSTKRMIPTTKTTSSAPAIPANDNASQYTNWVHGANGGSGFGPWDLQCVNNAGFFLGNSLDNSGGSGGINRRGKSWGMFAHSQGNADAYRPFADGPLALAPQRFMIDIDNGLVDPGASVGLGLQNGNSNTLWEFFFVGGNRNYTVRDGTGEINTGIPFTTRGLHCTFVLTEATAYAVDIVCEGQTNTLKGRLIDNPDQEISRIHLWNFNAGSGPDHDVYFNSIQISN